MIACTELIAVDLFNAEARRIQLGEVEQYLARLRNHPSTYTAMPVSPMRNTARPLPGMLSTPTRTEVAAKNHRLAVRFFWCFLIGATTLSLVGNIAHAVLPHLTRRHPDRCRRRATDRVTRRSTWHRPSSRSPRPAPGARRPHVFPYLDGQLALAPCCH